MPLKDWAPKDPENLSQSARVHFLVCKFLGIIPFAQIRTPKGVRCKTSIWGQVYAVVALVIYITFFQMAVAEIVKAPSQTFNGLSVITAWGMIYANWILMLIGIFSCWFNQKNIISIMDRFMEADEQLDHLHAKPSYVAHYKVNALHLTGLLLLVFTSVMSNCALLNPDGVEIRMDTLCYWFICFFPITINLLTLTIFVYLLRFSRVRLGLVNTLVSQAIPITGLKLSENGMISMQVTDNPKSSVPTADRVKFILQLAAIHSALCQLARRINGIFGFHLLANVAVCFGVMTVQLYYMFVMIIGTMKMVQSTFYCILICIVVQFTVILFIVTAGSSIEAQARRTGVLLHTWNTSTCEKLLHNTIEMFSMQILHNSIEITAFGFFRLDFGLVTSIVGAVTTYLVIIIQFHLAETPKPTKAPNE